MKLQTTFDATQYDPTQGGGQLPLGRHPVVIETSEVKASKAGDSGYLQLNLRVTEGPAVGETGPMRFNLYHSNAKTVEIAHKQLSAVCHVTGVFALSDSAQLHNIPFVVEVGAQSDPKYTEVKRVYDMRGNEPHRQGTGAQQGAAQPQQAQAPQQAAPAQAPAQAAPWGAPQQAPTQPAPGVAPQTWGQPAQQPQQAAQPATAPAWGQTPSGAPASQPNGAPPWGQPR